MRARKKDRRRVNRQKRWLQECAMWFRRLAYIPRKIATEMAKSTLFDSYDGDIAADSPRDAALEELSYWTD